MDLIKILKAQFDDVTKKINSKNSQCKVKRKNLLDHFNDIKTKITIIKQIKKN